MKAIYLSPYGSIDERAMSALEESCWEVFGYEVKRIEGLPEPMFALNTSLNQCNSALLLKDILGRVPKDAIRVLGVTNSDLYIPMLSFVFGHAQLNGPAAVISLARLHPMFYRMEDNADLFLRRVVKEAVHELGHTFGLIHCPDPHCAMSLSNAIQQVDVKKGELCDNCSILFDESTKQLRRSGGIQN
ncbi:MAG: archaemetzincin family Zn-dependent metalloprotease [Bacteroidota bacterium]